MGRLRNGAREAPGEGRGCPGERTRCPPVSPRHTRTPSPLGCSSGSRSPRSWRRLGTRSGVGIRRPGGPLGGGLRGSAFQWPRSSRNRRARSQTRHTPSRWTSAGGFCISLPWAAVSGALPGTYSVLGARSAGGREAAPEPRGWEQGRRVCRRRAVASRDPDRRERWVGVLVDLLGGET